MRGVYNAGLALQRQGRPRGSDLREVLTFAFSFESVRALRRAVHRLREACLGGHEPPDYLVIALQLSFVLELFEQPARLVRDLDDGGHACGPIAMGPYKSRGWLTTRGGIALGPRTRSSLLSPE